MKLNGQYSIIGYGTAQNFLEDYDSRYELISILKENHFQFDFSEIDSTVRIDKRLGNKLFGSSTFKYKLGHKTITLINHERSIEIPYWKVNETIMLKITRHGIMHFSITSYHNTKKHNKRS